MSNLFLITASVAALASTPAFALQAAAADKTDH
jgi:hypothetical protein